jgi:hypothetical protein
MNDLVAARSSDIGVSQAMQQVRLEGATCRFGLSGIAQRSLAAELACRANGWSRTDDHLRCPNRRHALRP